MKTNQNKNGKMEISYLAYFIIIGLFVFGILMIITGGFKGFRTANGCENNGGVCSPQGCDLMSQYPLSGDKAAGCESGETCCVDYNKPKPADKRCVKQKEGYICDKDKNLYCDSALQCVTKCDYCRHNFRTDTGKTICGSDKYDIFENASRYQQTLGCECTQAECTQKGSSECLNDKGFCPTIDKFCCII